MERVEQCVVDYDVKQRYWKRHGQLLGGGQHRQQFALRHSNGCRAGAHCDSGRGSLQLFDFTAERCVRLGWRQWQRERERRQWLQLDCDRQRRVDHDHFGQQRQRERYLLGHGQPKHQFALRHNNGCRADAHCDSGRGPLHLLNFTAECFTCIRWGK